MRKMPALEFRREAWVLARLEASWAENRKTNPVLATSVAQESAGCKYWEYMSAGERERLDGAEIHDK